MARKARKVRKHRDSRVSKTYILQAETGMIKIGRSANPAGRVAELQNSSPVPLNLLGIIDEDVERKLHQQFAHLRSHGEWFQPLEPLRKFIEKRFKDVTVLGPKTPMGVPYRDPPGIGDYISHMESKYDAVLVPWKGEDEDESPHSQMRSWLDAFLEGKPCLTHDPQDDNCGCEECTIETFISWVNDGKPNAILLPENHYLWMGAVYYPFSSAPELRLIFHCLNQAFYFLDALGPSLNAIFLEENGTWRCELPPNIGRISSGPQNLDQVIADEHWAVHQEDPINGQEKQKEETGAEGGPTP